MRTNLVLALVFAISGFTLCILFLVLLNVQIPEEPFSLWSELPYAGMFQYAGIICLAGAILYLLMETFENAVINAKNLVVIAAVVLANFVSFFLGGYHTLLPTLYLVGLIGSSVVGAWAVVRIRTKDLVSLVAMAILVAAVDEYAHTSAGTLTYFDRAVPSPLTVFGWSLFMILLVTIAKFMMRMRLFDLQDQRTLRIIPVISCLILVSAAAVLQGYVSVFNWVLVLVYVMLGLASFYYTYGHSLKWNISLMTSSLVFGAFMEFTGRWEGLWAFRFMEPVSLLILFSWPLRIWTVNALCLLFDVDFGSDDFEKEPKEISDSVKD